MNERPSSNAPSSARQFAGLIGGLAGLLAVTAVAIGLGFYSGSGVNGLIGWLSKSDAVAKRDNALEVAAESRAPLFADWPTQNPEIALLLTGEWLGHMRPCGCSENQQGGLAHLGELKRYLTEDKKWNVVSLDLGDLVGPDPNSESGGSEVPLIDRRSNAKLDQLKYRYFIEALKKLGYDTIGIGLGDLRIGATEIVGEAINLQTLRLIAANFGYSESDFQAIFTEVIKPLAIVERGGVKIGVCSLIANSQTRRLPDTKVSLTPQDAALKIAKAAFDKAGVNLRILLVHMPVDEAVAFAAKAGNFDLILCSSTVDDPSQNDIKRVGNTVVAWAGRKGKWALVAGNFQGETTRLRVEIVPLDNRLSELTSMTELYARYVRALKDDDLLSKVPRLTHSSKSEYVGAAKCGECHTKAYTKWKDSKHAHAMDSLVNNQKPPGQQFNPECVSCHSTGQRFVGGFVSLAKTPQFAGNQCENCHGPGGKHAADKNNKDFQQAMKLNRATVARTCYECHDKDNSPKFEFENYFNKIVHPWKD